MNQELIDDPISLDTSTTMDDFRQFLLTKRPKLLSVGSIDYTWLGNQNAKKGRTINYYSPNKNYVKFEYISSRVG